MPLPFTITIMRRDSRMKYPSLMEEYIGEYGYHFNKKLFEFAVDMMESRDGEPFDPWDKKQVNEFLEENGVEVDNNVGHDLAYVLNMARADYFGSSIKDDESLAKFVKDYADDPDGSETRAFDEFWIKTVALGIPIFWDEVL